MFIASPNSLVLATFLGGWEVVLILAVFLILVGAKKLPEIMRGMGAGMSEFRKELDREAHDAGKSAGGIFGKAATEALTPNNQTAELYDPAVFRRGGRKRYVRQLLRELWRNILKWLRITH
jgi:TatA/E family protein of Tat protein translocase